ncbi:hypothetical protein Nepgr_018088 [Nepenthes gracilis]|uniref:Pentatricopeptide repeat-containing protein n=1 Tax=Nepenthes gracilis TaxID=150966 RepID=A0AAD3STG9_NEPGR|nr:hypothetical protein Nepgr_018088 [Nepenthes gracilis]
MQLKSLKDGLFFHVKSIKSGIQPTIFSSNQLIHLYAKNGFLHEADKLFDEMPYRNVFTWNTIIAAHVKNHNLTRVEVLFNSSPRKDLVTYNSMLSGYVNIDGYEVNALRLFVEMQYSRPVIGIDEFTITTMLNLVAKLAVPSLGMQLHSYMVKSGSVSSGFSVSSLIDMYSKCGFFQETCQLFGEGHGELDLASKNAMVAACCREGEVELGLNVFWLEPELNDTVSWNTMISGFERNGFFKDSLKLFVYMVEKRVRINEHTFSSVLSACSGMRSVKLGKEVHARVLKEGFNTNPYITSGIVDVYCKCGYMEYAELANAVFGSENTFSVTSLILGYSYTGNMAKARWLFDSLAEKNSVVWTALFSGYMKSRQCEEVFMLLKELVVKETYVLDALILISVLGACAIRSSLDPGKEIHSYILRTGIEMDKKLMSSIIDMYSKCGNITYAERIFKEVMKRDKVLYNVMIAGYAHHGHEDEAINAFNEMLGRDVRPDAATFVALMSACRHVGSVELGEKFLHSMTIDHDLTPETDHYACMVDLYGRANQLEKAVLLMRNIPIEPDPVIWGAFLNACKINGNMGLAREAEDNLLRIEGDTGARYIQLANVYAAEGNWNEMRRVMEKMKRKNVKKLAGCSWVYTENGVSVFTSGDTSHARSESIYSTLACLTTEIDHIALE